MKIEDTGMYPEYKRKAFDIVLMKRIILAVFLTAAFVTGLVNLLVGGKLWFLYVWQCFWFVFICAMIESGF